jgi:DNA-binding transcriptional MerR regulator
LTIQELADRADVTTRTIRYYVEQGVLPPPERGRPAEYTEEHVARLALIKRLKEQYLPLEEIRDTLQRLSLAEVEALVADYSPQQEQAQKVDSAADYIANVLGRGAVREQMKASTEHRAPGPQSAPRKTFSPGSAGRSEDQTNEFPASYPQLPSTPEPVPALAPPATASAPAPASPQAQTSSLASRLWSSVVGRRSSEHEAGMAKGEGVHTPTSWQRVKLGEGIELHYVATGDARFNEMVMRLIESARRVLDEGPGNGE